MRLFHSEHFTAVVRVFRHPKLWQSCCRKMKKTISIVIVEGVAAKLLMKKFLSLIE